MGIAGKMKPLTVIDEVIMCYNKKRRMFLMLVSVFVFEWMFLVLTQMVFRGIVSWQDAIDSKIFLVRFLSEAMLPINLVFILICASAALSILKGERSENHGWLMLTVVTFVFCLFMLLNGLGCLFFKMQTQPL